MATGLVAAPPVAPSPDVRVLDARLTSGSTLGDGTALIMGGSGVPIPPARYVDNVEALFLQPHGFTGTAHSLFTPELFYPGNISEAVGARLLGSAIQNQISAGQSDAANPVVVFGYSQSAAMVSMTMDQLRAEGVPADAVHFTLVGNSAVPNGGILTRFDIPPGSNWTIPQWSLTLGHPTPDFYPTDVYTIEYDGYADFPRYPLNLLADLNAFAGMITTHLEYLALTPERIAGAIPLETTGDGLTDYYMIPAEHLPLMELLRLQPVWGKPLADLLEPALRVLVNLGYGSIDHGWSDGPANVSTPINPFLLFPPDVDPNDVFTALVDGVQQGMHDAFADLFDPDTYRTAPLLDNPLVVMLADSLYAMGLVGSPSVSMSEILANMVNSVLLSAVPGSAEADFLTAIGDWISSLWDADAGLPPIMDAIEAF